MNPYNTYQITPDEARRIADRLSERFNLPVSVRYGYRQIDYTIPYIDTFGEENKIGTFTFNTWNLPGYVECYLEELLISYTTKKF